MKDLRRFVALLVCAAMLLSAGVYAAEDSAVTEQDRINAEAAIDFEEAGTTEPTSTEPVATEPVSTEPAATEPVTTEPAVTEPTEPAVTEPEPTEPEPTEPEPEERPDEAHDAYLQGFTDGSFRPNADLSRAETAQILWRLGDFAPGEGGFSDVPDGKWYTKAINALHKAGILQGYSDGSFRPEQPVTRAELAKTLSRLSGLPEPQEDPGFSDVSESHWGRGAIALAKAMGWVVGYSDGSFHPNENVTRAEAVTMINRFLGRVPDREAIAAGQGLRFFPDVRPGAWYYVQVMEASTSHGAHYESPESTELWQEPRADSAGLRDGFYCVNNKLYAAVGGDFVHQASTGSLNGIDYRCGGDDGVCTVSAEVLVLADGNVVLLKNGVLQYPMGACPEGYYVRGGKIYASARGYLVHKAGSGQLKGYRYSCTGADGVCTVATELLTTVDGVLWHLTNGSVNPDAGLYDLANGLYCANSGGTVLRNGDYNGLHFGSDGRYTSGNTVIDNYVEGVLNSETNASMTQERKLFACYCYVALHSAKYLSNNDHVPRGQDCSLWSETYMLRLINMGRGNCYCFASEFYYLARRLGYWQAKAISGGIYSKNSDHGWVEMELADGTYVFDPRAEYSNYIKAGREPGVLYMRTYIQMPWVYHFT